MTANKNSKSEGFAAFMAKDIRDQERFRDIGDLGAISAYAIGLGAIGIASGFLGSIEAYFKYLFEPVAELCTLEGFWREPGSKR